MSDGFLDALEKGIALFNEQKFFEAYEVFEDRWNIEEDDGADLLQGLLQLSVGCSKFETRSWRYLNSHWWPHPIPSATTLSTTAVPIVT